MLAGVNHPELFKHTPETEVPHFPLVPELRKAYVIYIKHASFQLYHCAFPQRYLRALYENGKPDDEIVLNRTKFYNFAEPEERGEWFDVFVALIQYLVSGESKAGFLNKHHPANLLNKVLRLWVQN